MNWENIYLGCFSFGFLTSFAALVMHTGHAHFHGHGAHGPAAGHAHSHGGFSKLNRRRRDFLPGIPSLSLDGDTSAHIVILPRRATMSIASGGDGLRK